MANLCVFSDKIVFCMDKKVKISRFLSLIYKKFNHFGSNFANFVKTVLQKTGHLNCGLVLFSKIIFKNSKAVIGS